LREGAAQGSSDLLGFAVRSEQTIGEINGEVTVLRDFPIQYLAMILINL
jgi:hypothetical protein